MSDRVKTVEASLADLDTPAVRAADFELLFEQSPTGIAIVHAEGYFLRVNAAFCDLVGYSSTELVKRRRFQDITHPDDVEADASEAARILDGESEAYRILKRYLNKRGHSVWVQLQVTHARTPEGAFIHFVAHAAPMPVSDEFFRVETNADGAAAIRPFYPLAKLLRDNWKVVVPFASVVVGSIGTLGTNYVAMRAETSQQREIISYQQKELDRQKAEIVDMRIRLDRMDRK